MADDHRKAISLSPISKINAITKTSSIHIQPFQSVAMSACTCIRKRLMFCFLIQQITPIRIPLIITNIANTFWKNSESTNLANRHLHPTSSQLANKRRALCSFSTSNQLRI